MASSLQIKLFIVALLSPILLCPISGYPYGYQGGDDDLLSVDKLIRLTERYLTKFDMTLAIQIKPYVEKLKDSNKEQFLKDIEEMNEVIEEEILMEMVKASEKDKEEQGRDEEGLSRRVLGGYGDVARNAIFKVVTQYKKKPWMQRIMDFAGNEIQDSVNKM